MTGPTRLPSTAATASRAEESKPGPRLPVLTFDAGNSTYRDVWDQESVLSLGDLGLQTRQASDLPPQNKPGKPSRDGSSKQVAEVLDAERWNLILMVEWSGLVEDGIDARCDELEMFRLCGRAVAMRPWARDVN